MFLCILLLRTSKGLSYSIQVAITNFPRLGGLDHRNFSSQFKSLESARSSPANPVSIKSLFLGLQMSVFSSVLMWSRAKTPVSSHKSTNSICEGATFIT